MDHIQWKLIQILVQPFIQVFNSTCICFLKTLISSQGYIILFKIHLFINVVYFIGNWLKFHILWDEIIYRVDKFTLGFKRSFGVYHHFFGQISALARFFIARTFMITILICTKNLRNLNGTIFRRTLFLFNTVILFPKDPNQHVTLPTLNLPYQLWSKLFKPLIARFRKIHLITTFTCNNYDIMKIKIFLKSIKNELIEFLSCKINVKYFCDFYWEVWTI